MSMEIKSKIIPNENIIKAKCKDVVRVAEDYEKLKNLPTLDGRTIVGDIPELDPTVPDWAKDTKPQEMSFSDIKGVWDSIFSNGGNK